MDKQNATMDDSNAKEVPDAAEDLLLEKIGMVMRQTDYTEEVARAKLLAMGSDVTLVLKDFFAGTPK